MKSACVHMTGSEVASRFAHRLKLDGFAVDGLRIGFDLVSRGHVVSPDGTRPNRKMCFIAAESQLSVASALAWQQFISERSMAHDHNQYLAFRRGFLYGMHLAYRHVCQVIQLGQPRPNIGPHLQSIIFMKDLQPNN